MLVTVEGMFLYTRTTLPLSCGVAAGSPETVHQIESPVAVKLATGSVPAGGSMCFCDRNHVSGDTQSLHGEYVFVVDARCGGLSWVLRCWSKSATQYG